MLKLILVLCVLQLTTSVCYGNRFEEIEMKNYLVKPVNREQVQSLNYLRETQSQYLFQGGPMRAYKSQYVMIPHQLENEFLTQARRHNLYPQEATGRSNEQYGRSAAYEKYYGNRADQRNNFIEKEIMSGNEECTKQLGEACLEDDDCCEGSCKPLTSTSRSCQN